LLTPLLDTRERERLERIRDLVERIAFDRSIIRVDEIARASGLGKRALQRCFCTHVGVLPKSVIQRYRLHEAALQLRAPDPPPLAELAFARSRSR
jgi:AraC-like DNA-binding protein